METAGDLKNGENDVVETSVRVWGRLWGSDKGVFEVPFPPEVSYQGYRDG